MYKPYEKSFPSGKLPQNPTYKQSYKNEIRKLILNQHWKQPVFMTFAYNCHKLKEAPDAPTDRITYFDKRVDWIDWKTSRSTLGRHFLKKPHERASGFGFREHLNSNYHNHFILDIRQVDRLKYSHYAKRHLIDVIPSATFDLQPIKDRENLEKVVGYVLKEQSDYSLSRKNGYIILNHSLSV